MPNKTIGLGSNDEKCLFLIEKDGRAVGMFSTDIKISESDVQRAVMGIADEIAMLPKRPSPDDLDGIISMFPARWHAEPVCFNRIGA